MALKTDDIIQKCSKLIEKGYKKDVEIKLRTGKAKLNGMAYKKKQCIDITGDWEKYLNSENTMESANAEIALLYIIGHELGHLDNEPTVLPPERNIVLNVKNAVRALIRKDFRSHIREFRADYCGIKFVMDILKTEGTNNSMTRNDIIRSAFDFLISIYGPTNGDTAHPSFELRKEILLGNPSFDEELIRKIKSNYKYKATEDEVNQLCSCALNGIILKTHIN